MKMFHPRRIVWGRLAARMDKRENEKIIRVRIISVEREVSAA